MRNLKSNELQHVYGGNNSDHRNSSNSYSQSHSQGKHKHNSSNSYSNTRGNHKG